MDNWDYFFYREHYFDGLKKELCFDVNGRFRTTARLVSSVPNNRIKLCM